MTSESTTDHPRNAADSLPLGPAQTTTIWAIGIALAVGTLVVFCRALVCEFISLDDKVYVVNNPAVNQGLSWETLRWCLTTPVAGNWHPLTMMSHVLDGQLFGLEPWGHHLTSVLLHAANVSLVFVVFWRLTARLGPSLLIAVLFAWHPLRVESVAWVSERKDVLSTFFWLLAMLFYVNWVEHKSWGRYLLVCVALALGLASKAMLVTLPCVFLLLDFWPLGRLSDDASGPGGGNIWRRVGQLVVEKLPQFAIVIAFIVATLRAQQGSGAIFELSWSYRLFNALQSYVAYLQLSLWPVGLYIPHPLSEREYSTAAMITTGIAIGLITLLACGQWKKRPYLTVGWLWYLGTLVPVVGIATQAGYQAMADRFTYVPGLGLALMLAFALDEWARHAPKLKPVMIAGAVGIAVVLVGLTWRQLGFWKDSETLFRHAVACEPKNYVAHSALGHALVQRQASSEAQGAHEEAREHFQAALALYPRDDDAYRGLGQLELAERHWEAAASNFETAAALSPLNAIDCLNAAQVWSLLGCQSAVENRLQLAAQRDPSLAERESFQQLVQGLRADRTPVAINELTLALDANPKDVVVLNRLARILATSDSPSTRDGLRSLRLAQEAVDLTQRQNPFLLDTLAAAHAELKQFGDAERAAREAIAEARRWSQRDERWKPLVDEIEQRRQLYAAKMPYREQCDTTRFWVVPAALP